MNEYRYVENGFLEQECDKIKHAFEDFKLVCGNGIKKNQENDALLAMLVAKHTKSNAIVIVNNSQTVGIGAGQMSRVDSARIAIIKAQEANLELKNSVAASDAFLPFSDTVELLANAGVKTLIQPGGSINDEEIIKKARELGINMYFTGIRHFKH